MENLQVTDTRPAMVRGEWVEIPQLYVVHCGNALWLDGDTVMWAPLSAQGTVLWNDRGEVDDWGGYDPQQVRVQLTHLAGLDS